MTVHCCMSRLLNGNGSQPASQYCFARIQYLCIPYVHGFYILKQEDTLCNKIQVCVETAEHNRFSNNVNSLSLRWDRTVAKGTRAHRGWHLVQVAAETDVELAHPSGLAHQTLQLQCTDCISFSYKNVNWRTF